MLHKPKSDLTLQIATASGLSLLIIVLMVIVGVDTKNISQNIISTRTDMNTRMRQSEYVAVLREETLRAEPKREILEGLLPKKDELFSFPKDVTALGSQSNVGVSFDFGSEGDGQIDYSLMVQGSYGSIAEFIRKIEDNFVFINISTFTLISRGNDYSIDLKGNAFFNDEEG